MFLKPKVERWKEFRMEFQVFFNLQSFTRNTSKFLNRFLYQKLSGNCYNDSVNETRIFFKTPSAKQNMLNDIIVRWIKAKIINIKWNEIFMETKNEIKERIIIEILFRIYKFLLRNVCEKKYIFDWRLNWEDKHIVFRFLVPQWS